VSEKLPPVLMREYRDQNELMAVFTRPSAKSTLTPEDFGFVAEPYEDKPGHDLLVETWKTLLPAAEGAADPDLAFETAFNAYNKPLDLPPPPSGELHPSGNGTYTTDHGMDGAFVGTVHPDGTVSIKDKPTVGDVHFAGIGIAGRANFDDWAMHEAGIDPYASAKRQWLDKTREERVHIGAIYRKEQLARTPEYVKRNLAWAWSKTETDPEARKQALFDLWDDCAEKGDDDLVAAGTGARLYVIGFIRAHLPQGAAGAFTPDDLTRLNAHKRSSATFQPY